MCVTGRRDEARGRVCVLTGYRDEHWVPGGFTIGQIEEGQNPAFCRVHLADLWHRPSVIAEIETAKPVVFQPAHAHSKHFVTTNKNNYSSNWKLQSFDYSQGSFHTDQKMAKRPFPSTFATALRGAPRMLSSKIAHPHGALGRDGGSRGAQHAVPTRHRTRHSRPEHCREGKTLSPGQ